MSTILIIIALYYLIRNIRVAIIAGMESRQGVQTRTLHTSSHRVAAVVTEEMDKSDQREMRGSIQERNESQEQHEFIEDLADYRTEYGEITFDQARQGMIWSIIYGPPRAHRSLSSERLHP